MMRAWPILQSMAFFLWVGAGSASDWTQFRGSLGTGLTDEKNLPSEWAANKNVQWKATVPGVAWSSPVVVGDRVYITTAITEKQPRPKPGGGGMGGMGGGRGRPPRDGGAPGGGGKGVGGLGGKGGDGGDGMGGAGGNGGGRGGAGGRGFGGGMFGGRKPPEDVYRWEVLCLSLADGKVLWKKTAAEHKPGIATHSKNTYASETPAADGERVYASFGPSGLFCYSRDGDLLWKKELGVYKMMASWGTGSSPAIDGERLYVLCDNEEHSFLAAFDKKTGNEIWRKDRQERSTWGTPFLWKNKKRTELVTGGSKKARSYDPATGAILWELGGFSGGSNASPAADDELLFVGTGGPMSDSPLFAVKAGAAGDLTLKEGEESNVGVAWSRKQAGPSMASPLVYQGRLYILSQNGGFLSCFDAKTGKPVYARQRLPKAKGFTSSPWAYDGKVFCLDEEGQAFVVQAGAEFKLLGTNTLDEMFMATPAISTGALFLRGIDHLYCIRKP